MSIQKKSGTEKTQNVLGIAFADGATGRRARIAGTGINVFTVIRAYKQFGCNWEALRGAYHWLSEDQLRAALAYYASYPDEIDERIRREEAWTPERTWSGYPFMRPSDPESSPSP